MCCWTHDERDRQDERAKIPFELAAADNERCRCRFGVPCRRKATQEDLLCDWCRETNHQTACNQQVDAAIAKGRILDSVIFETMIFTEDGLPLYREKYATEQEALEGHARAVDYVGEMHNERKENT